MAVRPDIGQAGLVVKEAIEVDGLLWKREPGAAASAEEFIRARSLIIEINETSSWSPWVKEDRAQEYEHAADVFEQWTRAEPGFRQWTSDEVEAWMARRDADFHARCADQNQQRAARAAQYDEDREQARLALLEQQAILAHATEQRDGLRDHRLYPAMAEDRRRDRLPELDKSVAAAQSAISDLERQVGDVDSVVDSRGWLPQERRDSMLTIFSARRCVEVRELRQRVVDQQRTLRAATDRTARAQIRTNSAETRGDWISSRRYHGWAPRTCALNARGLPGGTATSRPESIPMPVPAQRGLGGLNGSARSARCSPQ